MGDLLIELKYKKNNLQPEKKEFGGFMNL